MKNKAFQTVVVLFLVCGILIGLLPAGASADTAAQVKTPIQVAGGEHHTVVLYSDGTVAAIGKNSDGQLNVTEWKDIVHIAAGFNHTVGVRSDGTVVATGSNTDGQCNVGTWQNIVQVAAGEAHTLGLRADGTVVAVGKNNYHQCEVEHWTGITQIAAAMVNSLGLTTGNQIKIRGAFSTADNFYLGGWTDVISMACCTGYFAAVKANNTVVGYGQNTDPEGHNPSNDISVDGWRNIAQMAVGRCNAFGLTKDGYVRCSGRNDFGQLAEVRNWNQIVYLGAGLNHVIGIRQDGTLVAAGDNSYDKCNMALLNSSGSSPAFTGVYLNELTCSAVTGKVWTRSDAPTPANFHTPSDAPGCWSDYRTPGHSSGPVRDNRGNLYTYGLHVDGSETASYSISFELDGKYQVFTGVCGYPQAVINPQSPPRNKKSFEVYGDGALLYTSPAMDANTDPVPFEVDIRNVYTLTINYPATGGENEAATLFDPIVR